MRPAFFCACFRNPVLFGAFRPIAVVVQEVGRGCWWVKAGAIGVDGRDELGDMGEDVERWRFERRLERNAVETC